MDADRPSLVPILNLHSLPASTHSQPRPTLSCSEIGTTKIIADRSITPSLPSPPLSPHQFTHSEHHGSRVNSLPMVPVAIRPPLIPSAASFDHSPSMAQTASIPPLSHTLSVTTDHVVEEEGTMKATVPLLPSQLRKRHESMKLLARTSQSMPPQEPLILKPNSLVEYSQEKPSSLPTMTKLELQKVKSDHDNKGHDDDDIASITASYHSGTMVRAKSYSMFESSSLSSNSSSPALHRWTPSDQMQLARGLPTVSASMTCPQFQHPYPYHPQEEMPTKDWVKMQSKMQALELEVSHVRRTNLLLNHELDKVNAHLSRITAGAGGGEHGEGQEGEGWRREYEFMVQQVDWMHRQLQIAHAEQQRVRAARMDGSTPSGYQDAEMRRELCAEVKDLTASLRMWQSAFKQAEEKYRRKCDGEHALKQTLREREGQLSSLVEKLSGYEGEFQKSISNYEEFMRLSADLELLEGSKNDTVDIEDSNKDRPCSPSYLNSLQPMLDDTSMPTGIVADKSDMPGTFPGQSKRHSDSEGLRSNSSTAATPDAPSTTIDQLSVSILSWAALLATYMLS